MIRAAETDADLAGWCAVWTAITPREPITVKQIRARLERQPWRLYLVAEEDGVVGTGFVGPTDSRDRIGVAVRVLPEWRRRGIGSQLYERVLERAVQRQPEWISSTVSGHATVIGAAPPPPARCGRCGHHGRRGRRRW